VGAQHGAGRGGGRRTSTLASEFVSSLDALVHMLKDTTPHFVRCVKPNGAKAPTMFAAAEVLRQLTYSGMMEAIRIRQQGFGLRVEHRSFMDRFGCLQPSSRTLASLVAGSTI
jgi:myosin-7